MESQQIEQIIQKADEPAETASNQQIDQEMKQEEQFLGCQPVPDGFFADINNSQACSVRVAVKCRPIMGRELFEKASICLETDDQLNTITIGKDRCFTFDKVFGMNSCQEEVFESCVKNLVLGCFQGYNATVLAYGQTGSGKTYTMGSGYTLGISEENQGIIPRVNQLIFDEIEARKSKAEFIVKCAFLEIYNEELIDLLDCQTTNTMLDRIMPQKKEINIREEKNGMISVYPLKEVEVKGPQELSQCLDLGSNQRSVASTLMNQQSSRSHGIFTITIEQHFIADLLAEGVGDKTASPDEFMVAKFHFVDLAGSERAKKTGATGATMKEGININQSLLSLGNVIAALTGEGKRNAHIPYRDSKLTRILQDSLGGNSRTSMIACCSPAETNFEETLNTLKYASRARNIKNKPVVNRDPASQQIAALRQQVYELQVELSTSRDLLTSNQIPFQSTIILPPKSSLMSLDRQIAGPPQVMHSLANGAEIQKMESQIQELKAAVSSKEKELQSTRAKLEALQDQHSQTQIDQFGAQRDRDLCRYQLEQIITALRKHKVVYTEVVKEINQGKLPTGFDQALSNADSILDPVFGNSGPTILEEYQTKVEEQRIEVEKIRLELKAMVNDNGQLIEQASQDTKQLETKELEIERLKRTMSKLQKENEQIKLEQRKQNNTNTFGQAAQNKALSATVKFPQKKFLLSRRGQVETAQIDLEGNWISSDLDNKLKQFEEVRKGFFENLSNKMGLAMVPADKVENLIQQDKDVLMQDASLQEVSMHEDSDAEQEEQEDQVDENSMVSETILDIAEDSHLLDIDDNKELMAKINTQQREVSVIDNQVNEMEKMLSDFKQSQRELEQSLLKAMEEEYHNKIHLMQSELKRLDTLKNEDLKKATGTTAKTKIESQFKQKEQELTNKLSELKMKEKEQSQLQKALQQQKMRSKTLENELDRMKQHKVQMLKKMQDDQISMAKWKKQRAQEVMTLKKQILKKEKENDLLKRENKKREIFAKRKQEEIQAIQQKQKLDMAKKQNAMKQRQETHNIDVDKIRNWILENTEKLVDFKDIENEKEKEIGSAEKIELEIMDYQEQFTKMIVAVEKLEQQKSRLMQAPEGSQDDNIYSIEQDIESLNSQMKNVQDHIDSLEDKQTFLNNKISKYNCDLIKLKNPANNNVLEDIPLQTTEGLKAIVTTFFDILLDTNITIREYESQLEDKSNEICSMIENLDQIKTELQHLSHQKELELKQVHQEYTEKEHKLIQFMVDNTGVDLGAKAEEESLEDINILSLLALFLKQKKQGQQVEQKDSTHINPGLAKVMAATQKIVETKKEAYNLTKAALARQVADLERQLVDAHVANKRLKNDQVQTNAEKVKFKRLLENEIDKNKKREQKSDNSLQQVQNPVMISRMDPSSNVVFQNQPLKHNFQSLQNQRNQRKLKKMITTVNPVSDLGDVLMEDEEEEKDSPLQKDGFARQDVFTRLSSNQNRFSTRSIDKKHSFFMTRKSSEGQRQSSPSNRIFEDADDQQSDEDNQEFEQPWELVIDKQEAHKSQIFAMTSVGTHLYTSANKSLKIWDVETMRYISDLPEKIGLVKAIAFWNERNLLLTAAEKVIMMWDVISLTTVGKFTGFKEEIKALQLVPGSDLMFAASKGTATSGGLLIYDLRKSQQPLDEKEKNQDIFSLTASPSHLFFGCRNHTVNPFCLKTFTSLAQLQPPHFDVVTSLAILKSNQQSQLISGSRDHHVRSYIIGKDQFLPGEQVSNAHNDHINVFETDKENTTLYSGSRDGILKVWSMSEEPRGSSIVCRNILEGNSQNSSINTICRLEMDPSQGQAFACGSSDRSIRIWKYTHGQQLHTQRAIEKNQPSTLPEPEEQKPESVFNFSQVIEKEQTTQISATDRLRQKRYEKQMLQQNQNQN